MPSLGKWVKILPSSPTLRSALVSAQRQLTQQYPPAHLQKDALPHGGPALALASVGAAALPILFKMARVEETTAPVQDVVVTDLERVVSAQQVPHEKDGELVAVESADGERLPFSKARCVALVATIAAAPFLSVSSAKDVL